MTITRDIARDLLPAYWSGEASADTRAAVEAYLAQDPAFAEEASRAARALADFEPASSDGPDAATRIDALDRTKRVLRAQRILFALATTFSLNALTLGFSVQVDGGRWRLQWLALPGQGWLLVAVAVAAIVMWILYARVHRRATRTILGSGDRAAPPRL